MEWQPIETAPRTGRMVLFWSRKGGYFAGNWPPGHRPGVWHKIGGVWAGAFDRMASDATHWAKLKESPKTVASARPPG
jgi:hypothetical protein